MRVFVTGGTGAIGGYAVPALVAAGHSVTALARSAAKAEVLRGQGAATVEVSLFDPVGLAEAFRGQDAVVNLASALPSPERFILKSAWTECVRIRTEGSAAVVDAVLVSGIGRVVQESVSMIYRDGAQCWIDEGAGRSKQIVNLARRHVAFQAGRSDSYMSSIHLADAAAAVVAALDSPAGTHNVVDDEPVTKEQHTAALAEAVGVAPWLRGPGRLALLLADRTTSMTRSLRVSNGRFRAATQWAPRYPSVRQGYRAMVQAAAG